MPPDANANPATIRIVKTLAMRLELVKNPNWVFFIQVLFQQGCVIQSRADMDESGGEQGHPDRDMNNVPDRQEAAGSGEAGSLELAGGGFDLESIQGAGDLGVDVATDETADHDEEGEQGGSAGQAVELPGGMQQDEVRSDEAGEDMELEPGGHAAPTGGAAAFTDGIEDFGHEHEDETQDAQQVAEQSSGGGYSPSPKNHQGVDGANQNGG